MPYILAPHLNNRLINAYWISHVDLKEYADQLVDASKSDSYKHVKSMFKHLTKRYINDKQSKMLMNNQRFPRQGGYSPIVPGGWLHDQLKPLFVLTNLRTMRDNARNFQIFVHNIFPLNRVTFESSGHTWI